MSETRYKTRRDYIFNLGFRRGANDRDAAGLPYSGNTPWPTVIPATPPECSSEEDQKSWIDGYKMGYVIGASDKDLEKYNQVTD